MHLALSALALLAAYKSADAAVGMFDDSVVWRPNTPEWEGAFRADKDLKDFTKVSNAVYGQGIATPYVEKCDEANPVIDGFECFRVYLVLDPNIAANVYALYGSDYSEFNVATSDKSDFFQAPPGLDVMLGGVNSALFQFVPASRFDSWFTIGADEGDAQSQLSVVGIDSFGNVSSVTTSNGAIFASDPGSVPSGAMKPKRFGIRSEKELTENSHLIAQLTVKAGTTFTWVLNAQGRSSGAQNTWQEHGICITTTPLDSACKRIPKSDKNFKEEL